MRINCEIIYQKAGLIVPNKLIPGSLLILEELISLAFAVLVNFFIIIFMHLGQAWDIFILNLLIIIIIFGVATFQKHFDHGWVRFFRDWYGMVFLIVIYLENRRLIPLINPQDMDALFIRIDRFLFLGHDPTILLERITYPFLSEIFQILYVSFYFLPFTLCVVIYRTRPHIEFHINTSTIMMGFYLSFIGYYFFPAIGPRYTLEHLQTIPLNGILVFDYIRKIIVFVAGEMRDCCPSGHTMISLLTVLLARRYARRFFPVACIWALLIIFSLVYLRYHYVFDLVVGAALALPVYFFCPGIAQVLIFRIGHENNRPDMPQYIGRS
jgi:membrane-associated phospholipid phosphatase